MLSLRCTWNPHATRLSQAYRWSGSPEFRQTQFRKLPPFHLQLKRKRVDIHRRRDGEAATLPIICWQPRTQRGYDDLLTRRRPAIRAPGIPGSQIRRKKGNERNRAPESRQSKRIGDRLHRDGQWLRGIQTPPSATPEGHFKYTFRRKYSVNFVSDENQNDKASRKAELTGALSGR